MNDYPVKDYQGSEAPNSKLVSLSNQIMDEILKIKNKLDPILISHSELGPTFATNSTIPTLSSSLNLSLQETLTVLKQLNNDIDI